MFPEMHLTVNEPEKAAVGEKIQLCQVLAREQGGQQTEAWEACRTSTPQGEGSLWSTPWEQSTVERCLALCPDPRTVPKPGNQVRCCQGERSRGLG